MRTLLRSCLVLAATIATLVPGPALGQDLVHGAKFELFVSDVDESIAFYQQLGFEVAQRKSYGYTTLHCRAAIVALSPVPWWLPMRLFAWLRYPPLGTEIVFYTAQLEPLRRALEDAGYEPGPIRLQSWGDLDFRITDPDGYYIRVSEGGAIVAPPVPAAAT